MSANIDENLRHEKIQAEIGNLISNSTKLQAETEKLIRENKYYPAIVGATVTLAIVAVVKIFL